MKCPLCDADTDPIDLRSVGGSIVEAKRCTQCSGIWFPKPLPDHLDIRSIAAYEAPNPNYSVHSSDLICPTDHTLLVQSDHDMSVHSGIYWNCPDCLGSFFPKGQLALYARWQMENQPGRPAAIGAISPAQATGSVVSLFGLVVMVLASLNKLDLQAASVQTLPTSGPNVMTLVLLALTYLAGTILAVLGRKLPVILLGWGVITVCLIGFSVIIFGP